ITRTLSNIYRYIDVMQRKPQQVDRIADLRASDQGPRNDADFQGHTRPYYPCEPRKATLGIEARMGEHSRPHRVGGDGSPVPACAVYPWPGADDTCSRGSRVCGGRAMPTTGRGDWRRSG